MEYEKSDQMKERNDEDEMGKDEIDNEKMYYFK